MWFVLAGLLLTRKAFSTCTAAQVAYTVHMVFNIKTVCLHYVILEMHSFSMSAAKHFYDNPLSIYLDPNLSSAPCIPYILAHLQIDSDPDPADHFDADPERIRILPFNLMHIHANPDPQHWLWYTITFLYALYCIAN
jgi:hypothetical protein